MVRNVGKIILIYKSTEKLIDCMVRLLCQNVLTLDNGLWGSIVLRRVSTQENKHRIGSDWTLFHLVLSTPPDEKS